MIDCFPPIRSTMSMDIVKELHPMELPRYEVLPGHLLGWLDVCSSANIVVKEIMFPAILTVVSGLMAPKTRLQKSAIFEDEPINLFTIVLAMPGTGKSAALHAEIKNPIISQEAGERRQGHTDQGRHQS